MGQKIFKFPAWVWLIIGSTFVLVVVTAILLPKDRKEPSTPDIASLIIKHGYNAGFEAGKEDREKGFRPEPDVVYNQPIFRAVIDNYIDTVVQPFGGKGRDAVEDLLKNAFMRGYAAGYY